MEGIEEGITDSPQVVFSILIEGKNAKHSVKEKPIGGRYHVGSRRKGTGF